MEIQTSADPAVFRLRARLFRIVQVMYSEEDQGCRSRRLPPCAGVEGAPEEQNGRTQEEIVDVEGCIQNR